MVTTPKPLFLIDVDGPINPWRQITRKGYLPPKVRKGEASFVYEKHLLRPRGWETGAPLPVLLSPEMGAALRDLSEVFTLVWATTWVEDANRLLSPVLGLPSLPVIDWPSEEVRDKWAAYPRHRGSWKTKWIAKWLDDFAVYKTEDGSLARIPWVWVDDEINGQDRDWLRDYYGEVRGGPRVVDRWLFRIEPSHGLRANDIADLREWGERMSAGEPVNPG